MEQSKVLVAELEKAKRLVQLVLNHHAVSLQGYVIGAIAKWGLEVVAHEIDPKIDEAHQEGAGARGDIVRVVRRNRGRNREAKEENGPVAELVIGKRHSLIRLYPLHCAKGLYELGDFGGERAGDRVREAPLVSQVCYAAIQPLQVGVPSDRQGSAHGDTLP